MLFIVLTAQSQPLSNSEQFERENMANENPSLKRERQETCLSISYYTQPKAAHRLMQLGNGINQLEVKASSFQNLNEKESVWGHASYRNSLKKDIKWNETSDFLLLYPYVMGDGRGGNMRGEQYELRGGFNHRSNKEKGWSYGFEAGYRALQEYRQHDPRPNNTIADLNAMGSIAYNFRNHTIGIALQAGKYKQTNELIYLNELGAGIEYHLTGIGNDYTRFSGANNNTFYKGTTIGTQIDYQRLFGNEYSLNIDAAYNYFTVEKIIQDLNRMPLNQLNKHELKLEVAGTMTDRYAFRVHLDANKRQGYDNIFGDAVSNVFPKIGKRKNFHSQQNVLSTCFSWQLPINNKHWDISLQPIVTRHYYHSDHAASGNKFASEDFIYSLLGNAQWKGEKSFFTTKLMVALRDNTKTQNEIFQVAAEGLNDAIQTMATYCKQGEKLFRLTLRYDTKLSKRYGIFAETAWSHNWIYDKNNINSYDITVGLTL